MRDEREVRREIYLKMQPKAKDQKDYLLTNQLMSYLLERIKSNSLDFRIRVDPESQAIMCVFSLMKIFFLKYFEAKLFYLFGFLADVMAKNIYFYGQFYLNSFLTNVISKFYCF